MEPTASLNAKVSGVCILLGAVLLHLFNQTQTDLVPLQLLTIAILIMGGWAFADEMGLRKPLNRAGFICFMVSVVSLAVTILEPAIVDIGKYYLLYSFALLFAMLVWSTAFMHRKREVKLIGGIGALAVSIPLIALIAGHISVAVGAYIGVESLLNIAGGHEILNSSPVRAIEAMFIIWALATATILWKGKVS